MHFCEIIEPVQRFEIGAFICLVALCTACRSAPTNTAHVLPPTAVDHSDTPQPTAPQRTQPSVADTVVAGFGRLLTAYSSYADAEAVAGYHIPHSDLYPPSHKENTVVLRTLPRGNPDWRPYAESLYDYPPLTPESFTVDVGPSYDWGGDSTFTSGTPTSIGGRSGWLIHGGVKFAYKCGTIDDVTLWCSVTGPSELPADKFAEFVASIH